MSPAMSVLLLQRLVIPPVVVIGHKGGDCCFLVIRHPIGDLLDVPIDSLVIALELAIGLRVVGCCECVPDSYRPQVIIEGAGS